MSKVLEISIVSVNEFEREGLRQVLVGRGFVVRNVVRDHLALDLDSAMVEPNVTCLTLISAATHQKSIETCRFVRAHWPAYKIVVFASALHAREVFEMFRLGIDGYVGRNVSIDVLEQMLKLVDSGEKLVSSELFLEPSQVPSDKEFEELDISVADARLSDREIAILRGLIRGDSNKVIARRMAIAEATVKVHVKSILRKVSATNRTQAAIWGLSRGIASAGRS